MCPPYLSLARGLALELVRWPWFLVAAVHIPVRERHATRRRVHGNVLHPGCRAPIGDRRGDDPVARFSGAVPNPTAHAGPGPLLAGRGGGPVVPGEIVEEGRHLARVAGAKATDDALIELLVEEGVRHPGRM